MDYYCRKCGTPLNENGLCPKCQQSTYHTFTQTTSDSNNKKRKSKTLIIVSIVLAAIILVSGVVACLFCFDVFSTSTDNEITSHSLVITQNNHVYFSGCGSLIDITNDEQPMLLTSSDDNNQAVGLLPDRSAYDGENIYSLIADHRNIYKQTINGDGSATREIFVNEQSLKDAFTKKLGTDVINPASIYDLSICDNYLCFFFAPSLEFAVSDSDVAYKIGKINLDTKEIDFFDDIHASALAAKDGWIYYFNNGYTYNANNTYTTNSDLFGIYKMRIDGSENQLLLDGFEQDSSDMNDRAWLCNDLQIYDDYLYFTDDSKEGQSRVCRIMLDGSQKEYLTKEGAYNYTVDTNNNKLYYSTGLFNVITEDPRTVYEVSLETGDETELFKVTGNREFTAHDDYLYISDMYQFISFTKDGVLPCGKRYNLTNGSAEILYGKKDFEIQLDPNTGAYDIIGGDNTPVYYWEAIDTSTDYVL